jgi:hypothetical protein
MIMHVLRLTIRETAAAVQRQYGGKLVPDWKLRRIVDAMETRDALQVQRIGPYRTIADVDVAKIATELERVGWLKQEPTSC